MTDEERREAKRLADQSYLESKSSQENLTWTHAFEKGYEAAWEGNRRLNEEMSAELQTQTNLLAAELARSAMLIHAIINLRDGDHEDIGQNMDKLFSTLAEFEASK